MYINIVIGKISIEIYQQNNQYLMIFIGLLIYRWSNFLIINGKRSKNPQKPQKGASLSIGRIGRESVILACFSYVSRARNVRFMSFIFRPFWAVHENTLFSRF